MEKKGIKFRINEKRKNYITMTFEGKALVFLNKFFSRFMDKVVYNKMAKEPNSPLKK